MKSKKEARRGRRTKVVNSPEEQNVWVEMLGKTVIAIHDHDKTFQIGDRVRTKDGKSGRVVSIPFFCDDGSFPRTTKYIGVMVENFEERGTRPKWGRKPVIVRVPTGHYSFDSEHMDDLEHIATRSNKKPTT